VRKIKASSYIQLDIDWQLYKQIDVWLWNKDIDVFNCFWQKE
jgi:hypothetical protein